MAGLKYQTLVTWRRKHGKGASCGRQPAARGKVALMEAVLRAPAAGPAPGGALVVQWRDELTLRIEHPQQATLAAALIKALS